MQLTSLKLLLALAILMFPPLSCGSSKIEIEETKTGHVNTNITISNSDLLKKSPTQHGKKYGFALILIPFETTKEWIISQAQDVVVSSVASHKGYSLLSVVFPVTKKDDLLISIKKVGTVSENREGKTKLLLNLNYPFMAQTHKEVLELTFVHSNWDVEFTLLNKYEDDEVSRFHNSLQRVSDRKYLITKNQIDLMPNKVVWLVFPNAQKKNLDIVKFWISIFLGLITVLIQVPFIRDRKLSTVSGVFITSAIAIGISIYYAIILGKGFELAVWGAMFIPHVLMSFVGAIYVLIARYQQATIGVSVLLDNVAAEFCEVILWAKNGNNWVPIESVDRIVGGNGVFHVWLRSQYSSYKVSANSTLSEKVESSEFLPVKKQKLQVQPLKLKTNA